MNQHPHPYLQIMGIQSWQQKKIPRPQTALCAPPSDLSQLKQAVIACTACTLAQSRTQTVFGVGNPNADLMLIGEAPGFYEDKQGEPFVGRAGKLLNAMLAAIGFSREEVYIANILKCRPPNNRDPLPAEVSSCTPFLTKQIGIIQPKLLLAVGRISAQFLLNTKTPLSELRKKQHVYGPLNTPLLVTYHPAYLLRNLSEKAKAFQDLQQTYQLLTTLKTQEMK